VTVDANGNTIIIKGFSAQGTTVPATGAGGVELNFGLVADQGTVQAFSRDPASWKALRVRGRTLHFDISGSEKVTIDTSGMVGIGTTSPGDYFANANHLVIEDSGNAGMTIATTDVTKATQIFFADGTVGSAAFRGVIGYNHLSSAENMNFWVGAAEKMRITAGGNTGIGTNNPQEKLAIGNGGNLVMDKATNIGIKVDNVTPTFGFADIIGDQFSKNTGATKPTLATYNGVINAWQFGVGDEAYISFHIPHDYVAGTPIFLHVHWSHINTFVTGGTLTFKATSILSKSHNQQPFQSTPSVGTFTGTASTVQYQQILSEVLYSDGTPTGIEIDTANLEPDSVIEMTFEVDANNITVSSGGVPDPFVHFVDIHYQSTGLMGTKDKAPDFYA